jgi:hypothetical protein
MRRSHDCPDEHREPGQDRERDREALAYARRLRRRKCTNWCSYSWRRLAAAVTGIPIMVVNGPCGRAVPALSPKCPRRRPFHLGPLPQPSRE